MTTHFNALSGVLRKNRKFILGSSDGAVQFDKDMKLPRGYSSKMIFSDFKLFYQRIYPGDEDSPLKASINETKELIRVVRSPEGEISIDATGKKSGRGAYLCGITLRGIRTFTPFRLFSRAPFNSI